MQNDFDNNQLKYQISTGDQIPFQLTWWPIHRPQFPYGYEVDRAFHPIRALSWKA